MRARVDNRLADFRPEFDDGLMHLGFDLLLERHLPAFEDLMNVRAQLPRLRIDNGEFLLDAERVLMISFHELKGRETSADFADLHRLFQPQKAPLLLQSAEICAICG